MRYIVVTFLFQLSIFYLASGQVKPAKIMENAGQHSQKYSLGVRVGPSITVGHLPRNLPDTVLAAHSNKPKFGFTAVGQLSFPLEKDYSCLIELGYSRGGRKIEYNKENKYNRWVNDFTYNYITSSLGLRKAFKVTLKRGRTFDWYLSAGPNISYMLGGSGRVTIYSGPPNTDPFPPTHHSTPFAIKFHNLSDSAWYQENFNELGVYHFNKANRFFFGVDIGLGGYFPFAKRQKVYAEFRTTLGQTFIRKRDTKATLGGVIGGVTDPAKPDLRQGGPGIFSDPLTTNMKTFTLSAIYTFDFDKKLSKQGKSTLDKKRRSSGKRRR